MDLKESRCAGCGASLAGEDAVAAAGVLLCLPCARESGWAKRNLRVDPVAVAAGLFFVVALFLPWEAGQGLPGIGEAVSIKWLVGLSGLFLVALTNVRNERTNALFLLGPLGLLGALVLHWYTVESLRFQGEGVAISTGLATATVGVLLVAWALWRESPESSAPPDKG